MKLHDIPSVSDMIPRQIHEEAFFEKMVRAFSITVTEMFRDPPLFLALREKILPLLKSYPYIKVWHAGCATGEEAYSLAVLMAEEDLGDRATFFATDFNDTALEKARQGIYNLDNTRQYTLNYQLAGGRHSFSDYYYARYGAMAIMSGLKEKITFANHNASHVWTTDLTGILLTGASSDGAEGIRAIKNRGGYHCPGPPDSGCFCDAPGCH